MNFENNENSTCDKEAEIIKNIKDNDLIQTKISDNIKEEHDYVSNILDKNSI